ALPVLIIALAALALVVFAGAWWALTPGGGSKVDVSGYANDLPLRDGKRLGDSMSAVVADPGFATQSPAERLRRVTAVFTQARRDGVRVLVLMDDGGNVKATAQVAESGQPERVGGAP